MSTLFGFRVAQSLEVDDIDSGTNSYDPDTQVWQHADQPGLAAKCSYRFWGRLNCLTGPNNYCKTFGTQFFGGHKCDK
ncbi:MAG: hypothetical protein GFH25_541218n31 [Chloroflexi bacterium AL-N10]|nr:hypothetical protein [Chloroflexi bacterium AL-N1]NOK69893.1 hypothetical protein [Chloroflexi bacterium AL-N10]NOK73810.1 hypothetical protein [Chloroflexi bacterium AL-N5]NOK91626.1 hypothetical protein [Chloroflexi bacterium AL-N15]